MLSFGMDVINDVFEMIEQKTSHGADEGSMGVSHSMLRYMVTPRGLFGLGNIPEGYGFALDKQDIGLFSCMLDLFFFIMVYFKSIKAVFSKNRTFHLYGMAVLYFLLHSLKLGVLVFKSPILCFFVVLMIIVEQETNRNKSLREPLT